MDHSPAVERKIHDWVAKMEQFFDGIVACRIVVEAPHHHRHKGNLYHVRIDMTTPDDELIVSHQRPQDHAHEDVYVAIRDAFRAARRQMKNTHRKRKGRIKHHETPPHGRVVSLHPL